MSEQEKSTWRAVVDWLLVIIAMSAVFWLVRMLGI